MNDYDAGLTLTATEQAEYDAWQQDVDAAQQWEQHAALVAWVHDQEQE